ncbi:MAG: hypothetical protein RSD07_12460 [Angelakisella sp.]
MTKKLLAVLLAVLMITVLYMPAYAEEPSEAPTPVFTAEITLAGQGWMVMGRLSELPLGASSVVPYGSVDGTDFVPINDWEGTPRDWAIEGGPNAYRKGTVVTSSEQPLSDYLSGNLNQFWVKLNISSPTYNGFSNTVMFERNTTPVPPPEDTSLRERYAGTLRIDRPPSAKYHVTVREGTTPAELNELLPDTLPVEVQLFYRFTDYLGNAMTSYPVVWQLPSLLTAGTYVEQATTTPPADCIIHTANGTYHVQPGSIAAPLNLIVTVVPPQAKAIPLLNSIDYSGIDISLDPKPTGATAIFGEYSLDGGKTWLAAGGDAPKNATEDNHVERMPKNKSFTAFDYFSIKESPLKEYKEGAITGFLVRLRIIDGVFDGYSEVTPWPAKYQYTPPPLTSDGDDGSGGNRGDVGSDDKGNNGLRPNLPTPSSTHTPTAAATPLPTPTPTPIPVSQATAQTMGSADTLENSTPPSLDVNNNPTDGSALNEGVRPSPAEGTAQRIPSAGTAAVGVAAAVVVGGTTVAVVGSGGCATLGAKAAALLRKLVALFTR